MKYFVGTAVSLAVVIGSTTSGFAQDLNLGVPCARNDQDVNQVLRASLDPYFLNQTHRQFIEDRTNFNVPVGWTFLGGAGQFETFVDSPYHKYILSQVLITSGIHGQSVPVHQGNYFGFFEYDSEAFYVTYNHNLHSEYFGLAISGYRRACTGVNPLTGDPRCLDSEPDGWSFWARAYIAENYGQAEEVELDDTIPGGGKNYGGDPVRIGYSCGSFDASSGVVRTAGMIIHENFHTTTSDLAHVNCARGPGACAAAWDFDMPTQPRVYNALPTYAVDAYQVHLRYLCDLTEAPADWVPVMVQEVANERANTRGAQNRFQNILTPDPTTGIPVVTGEAPLSCGVPEAVLELAVGSICPATGTPRCQDNLDCGSGETCENLCCAPVIIIK